MYKLNEVLRLPKLGMVHTGKPDCVAIHNLEAILHFFHFINLIYKKRDILQYKCAEINLLPPTPISASFWHSWFGCFIEDTVTSILLQELAVVIHQWSAFRSFGLRESSHGSGPWDSEWDNASLSYRDWCWRSIFWQNVFTQSVKSRFVLFLEMNDEPRELYFWMCTVSVAWRKLTRSTYMICFFEL